MGGGGSLEVALLFAMVERPRARCWLSCLLYAVRGCAGEGDERGCGGRDRRGRREKSQPLSFLVEFSRSDPRHLAHTPSSILGIHFYLLFDYFYTQSVNVSL